jgi:transporter family-2 protein
MNKYSLLLIALIAGSLIPLQGSINAMAGKLLKHPLQATFVNFLGGIIALLLLMLALRPPLPNRQELGAMPWYSFTGGLLGVVFVTSIVVLMPRLGAATLIGTVIAGQLVMSVVFDHYGLMGLPQHPVSTARLLGVALLFGGIGLIQNG